MRAIEHRTQRNFESLEGGHFCNIIFLSTLKRSLRPDHSWTHAELLEEVDLFDQLVTNPDLRQVHDLQGQQLVVIVEDFKHL